MLNRWKAGYIYRQTDSWENECEWPYRFTSYISSTASESSYLSYRGFTSSNSEWLFNYLFTAQQRRNLRDTPAGAGQQARPPRGDLSWAALRGPDPPPPDPTLAHTAHQRRDVTGHWRGYGLASYWTYTQAIYLMLCWLRGTGLLVIIFFDCYVFFVFIFRLGLVIFA